LFGLPEDFDVLLFQLLSSVAHLDFKAAEMNDVLKSLTIEEKGGGKVAGLRYDSSEPLAQRLAEFPFQLGTAQPLSGVLDQLKGSRVELQLGPQVVAGAVLRGHEQHEHVSQSETYEEPREFVTTEFSEVVEPRRERIAAAGPVPEVAREIITSNEFTVDDIIHIGEEQTARVLEKTKSANKTLFCDTDLITTQIYSQLYLHEVPAILRELEHLVVYDMYFLFDTDVPWVPDGLRDLGAKRIEMLEMFRKELEKRSIPYVTVRGNWPEREGLIRRELDRRYSEFF